jgi:tetratricopeptide (TPR) repeat protein/transcriptional regulator with XRE-family HTH domain
MSIEPDGSFGRLLLRERVNAGLTQEQLAERAGLSVRTIRNLERGTGVRPREASARLLADALGLSDAARARLLSMARSARLPEGDASSGTARVPRQLPAVVRGFTGRAAQLEALTDLLRRSGEADGSTPIAAIDGMAGIGKTTLAVHWAHQRADCFPDGQLYVNLRGFDPDGKPLTAGEAIRGFLDALISDPGRIPARLEAQTALYRSLLADTRTLVVLDNARDADQVRPLLPGGPGCMVLVTSRRKLTSLTAIEGAHQVSLDLLAHGEAYEVLARRLGTARAAAEREAVDELIGLCARLPLALGVAAARAAAQPSSGLAELTAQLRETRRLDMLDAGDPASDVRAVFSWSYRVLSAPAARMFRLLSLHPGPDVSAAAAASLAGVPRDEAAGHLAELTRAHLLAEPVPKRFAFHDLLRAYASEQAHAQETPADLHAATERMLDHYTHTGHAAALLVLPTREALELGEPKEGTTLERFPDDGAALAWFKKEHAALTAVSQYASAAGFDTYAWQLPWIMTDYLARQGHWRELRAAHHDALAAARRLGDAASEARAHGGVARAAARLNSLDEAHRHLAHALEIHTRLGNRAGMARTHRAIGNIYELQENLPEALDHAKQGLELFRAVGDTPGEASGLNQVGWYLSLAGDHEQALAYCEQALNTYDGLGDRHAEAGTWDSIGYAHHHLGNYLEAVACHEKSVSLLREVGDRYYESDALTHLGDSHLAAGAPEAARDAWLQALEILTDLDHPDADRVRERLSALPTAG